jgi:hypothetical protein
MKSSHLLSTMVTTMAVYQTTRLKTQCCGSGESAAENCFHENKEKGSKYIPLPPPAAIETSTAIDTSPMHCLYGRPISSKHCHPGFQHLSNKDCGLYSPRHPTMLLASLSNGQWKDTQACSVHTPVRQEHLSLGANVRATAAGSISLPTSDSIGAAAKD